MTPEQLAEIQRLRDRQVAPKQIARKLGLRPAEVKLAIQEQAAVVGKSKPKGKLELCLANSAMVEALLFPERREHASSSNLGLGCVMVTRQDRGRFASSIFLVDYYCLGVKNVTNKKADKITHRLLAEASFAQFSEGAEEISLAQAQAIVYGAIDYARGLGFEPHQDFEKGKAVLGDRLDSLQTIEFGREGKPFYFQGPYDNADKVIATLDKSVGKGNYDWLLAAGGDFI
ncbi:MAG: hypothetical protein WBD47_07315 [Phormidesmis sp.]